MPDCDWVREERLEGTFGHPVACTSYIRLATLGVHILSLGQGLRGDGEGAERARAGEVRSHPCGYAEAL